MEILSTKERINIRGTINSLEVGDKPVKLSKTEYKLSTIRATAGAITGDTGKKFSVSVIDGKIVITRIA
ncbi:MAG: hypothetical protein LBQ74_18125 [Prevotella sp.]|jgi:hypothetical protein|nr:hypothetical protein [Prevotella sp.]